MSDPTLDAKLIRFRSRPGTDPAAPLAEELLAAGRHRDAIEVATIGLKAAPNDPRLLWLEGRALMSDGQLERAQSSLVAAAKLAPRGKEIFKTLAEVLLARGDFERAGKVIERGQAIDPTDVAFAALADRAKGKQSAPSVAPVAAPVVVQHTPIDDDEPEELASEATIARPASALLAGMMASKRPEAPKPAPAAEPSWSDDDAATAAFTKEEAMAALASLKARPAPVPGPAEDFDDADEKTNAIALEDLMAKSPAAAPPPSARVRSLPPPPKASIAPATARRAPAAPSITPPTPRPSIATPAPRPSVAAPSKVTTVAGMPSPAPAQSLTRTTPGMPSPASMDDLFANLPSSGNRSDEQFNDKSGARPLEALSDSHVELPVVPAPTTIGSLSAEPPRSGNTGKQPVVEPTIFERRAREAKTRRFAVMGAGGLLLLGAIGAGGYGYVRVSKLRQARAVLAEAMQTGMLADVSSTSAAEQSVMRGIALSSDLKQGEEVPALLLAQLERALEDGNFDVTGLDSTLARAQSAGASVVPPARVDAARLVLAISNSPVTQAKLEELGRSGDAVAAYVAGRIAQRLGLPSAEGLLSQAATADAHLLAVQFALAELDASDEAAATRLQRVLAAHPNHVRGSLYKAYFSADPAAALADLTRLEPALADAPVADVVLASLASARAHHRSGDAQKAHLAIDAAVAKQPRDPRWMAAIAREALRVGALEQAHAQLDAALAIVPNQARLQRMLVEVNLAACEPDAAMLALAKLDPNAADTLELATRVAILKGTPAALEDASRNVASFLSTHPDAPIGVRALGVRLKARLGDRAALAEARNLMRTASSDPAVLTALGEAALRGRDAATASDALAALTRLRPDDPDANYMFALARRAAGDGAGAVRGFQRALASSPQFVAARVSLLETYVEAGQFAEALQLADALMSARGTHEGLSVAAHAHVARALVLLAQLQAPQALATLDAIEAREREDARVKLVRAQALLASGKPADALALARPIAESPATSNAQAWTQYGDALYASNQVDAAGVAYLSAMTRTADYPEALLGRARVFVRAGKADDALTAIERLQAALIRHVRPASLRATAFTLLGQAKIIQHDNNAARDAFTRATSIEGAPAESFFFLGESLSQTDGARARQAYQRYLELAPTGEFAARARQALTPR